MRVRLVGVSWNQIVAEVEQIANAISKTPDTFPDIAFVDNAKLFPASSRAHSSNDNEKRETGEAAA